MRWWKGAMSAGFGILPVLWVYHAAAVANTTARPPADGSRATVIAELFTSEGCSSCPAADELLTKFLETQPIPGAEIVALGEHVDYWDRLGWRDPFSSAEFTARQSHYGSTVFGSGRIYTPQVVVDGQLEFVGSDAADAKRAFAQAAAYPKAAVQIQVGGSKVQSEGEVPVQIRVDRLPPPVRPDTAELLLAVTEDKLVTNVRRGENGGRTLRHSAVVRRLIMLGPVESSADGFRATTRVPMSPDWKRDNLRLVAFVQERDSRRIVGAAMTDLTASLAVSP